MTLHFRDARTDDAAALAELGSRSFTETFGDLYSPDDLRLFLSNHDESRWVDELSDPAFAVRIGEAAGEAVAYAKIGPPTLPFKPEGKPCELRQFYVLENWQGSGAAHEMMEWVIAESRRRSADELYLSVFINNRRARRFYERYGFERVGIYAFMVGSHADEDIVMRKTL
jgi:ribosomal protein S18 acetylase RimI-like enzyme